MIDFRKEGEPSAAEHARRIERNKIPTSKPKSGYFNYGRFWALQPLSSRAKDRMKFLQRHYTDERLRRILVPIVAVHSRLSLRALEWFVINYARRRVITFVVKESRIVNVYREYLSWRDYWEQELFDAFRRGPRLYFEWEKQTYATTAAQLNFLYWCELSRVFAYVDQHLPEIEADMNQRIRACRIAKAAEKAKSKTGRAKRSKLAQSPAATCMIMDARTEVRFRGGARTDDLVVGKKRPRTKISPEVDKPTCNTLEPDPIPPQKT